MEDLMDKKGAGISLIHLIFNFKKTMNDKNLFNRFFYIHAWALQMGYVDNKDVLDLETIRHNIELIESLSLNPYSIETLIKNQAKLSDISFLKNVKNLKISNIKDENVIKAIPFGKLKSLKSMFIYNSKACVILNLLSDVKN